MVNILARKAVLANLSMSSWGVRRFEDSVAEEIMTKHQADKKLGLFTKRLLNKGAMKDIRQIRTAARIYHNTMTLPWRDDGVRILPTVSYLEYAQQMGKFEREFETAVNKFVKDYPSHIKQAKTELGTLYNEEDYPPAAVVRKRFSLKVDIDPCPDSSDFRAELDPELLKDLGKDLDKRMEEMLNEAVKDAAERVTTVVKHMIERLKSYKPADKKKKSKVEGKFHDSLVENLRELAKLLPSFNLNNDPKLEAIHQLLLKELCIHDPDTLREDVVVRKQTVKKAEDILKKVQEFLA
jgi:hypothetical protein